MNPGISALPKARYSFGGDEHLFVEIDEEMSLPAFFKGMAICTELQRRKIPGVTEICPANAAYLIRFDPDIIAPDAALAALQEIEASSDGGDFDLQTRIVEIPVLYNDPWTHETLMRFRERHQDPHSTDIEYAARINGFDSVDAFIESHSGSPWFVSMVGFVAGLPFLFQMVDRRHQIEVPKYLSPRTDTPKLTLGHGLGAFGGLHGRKLQAGDSIPIGQADPKTARPGRRLDPALLPVLEKEVALRVLPGLYFHRLKEVSMDSFFADTWTVAPEADRIGYRYKNGTPLQFLERKPPFGAGSDPSNIVDAGYPYGSIQVPGGKEPIILHRDAVSGGGYAMVGTVISADMDRIAQMQPNNKVHFQRVDMHAALAARAERHGRLEKLKAALSL